MTNIGRPRKICIFTGARSEYGLLYWLMKEISKDPAMILQIVATGMHLSPEFGLTFKKIEEDGFCINEKIDMLLSGDSPSSIAKSAGLGIICFADALTRLTPDIVVLLGDRFEIFAAATASCIMKIPIAHIHGGEITLGAIDEVFRHSITKMATYHFPSTFEHGRRIRQLGENPKNIFCCGAPGIDNIKRLKLYSKQALEKELRCSLLQPYAVVTFHPATLESISEKVQVANLLQALSSIKDLFFLFTMPNADSGGRTIARDLNDFVNKNTGNCKMFISLGQLRYLSLLKYASVMIGNSSSGIIEAPSFELPVVNIGSRQMGRNAAPNVIQCSCKTRDIIQAIRTALSTGFRKGLEGLKNPYGNGNASIRIKNILKKVSIAPSVLKKPFFAFEP
jgi:UDP-hydrolysing UDP-N-acetyl-D-glucosamine 2-epimerase